VTEGWTTRSILRSPTLGDLVLNEQTTLANVGECLFLVIPQRCDARRGMRATVDQKAQDDGDIFHRRFANGVEFDLAVQFWIRRESQPACDEDARLMAEALAKWLDSIRNDDGRYLWTPTGYGDMRMLDAARWLTPIKETLVEDAIWEAAFTIDSPFPYVIDATQQEVAVTTTQNVTNNGNVQHYPVIKVNGAFTDFTITNNTNGQAIVYDDSLPGADPVGGGDYAEIDTSRSTIYLNGDEDNLAAGVDPEFTDYFKLEPGVNSITITGATATFLVNNAWHP